MRWFQMRRTTAGLRRPRPDVELDQAVKRRGIMSGVIDKGALKQKYAEERAKRLRPDGNDQYIRLKGQFDHYLDDPYTPVTPRPPKHDHVTFAFIGGGFAGLVTGARLKEAGL